MAPLHGPWKVQIVGHSFVRHLKDFISSSIDHAFNMFFDHNPLIQYSGFGGATVQTIIDNIDVISDFGPHIVVLVLGTCDIYKPANTPQSVANSIIQLVDNLQSNFGVQQVLVVQTFHRTPSHRPGRFPVDLSWFNHRVDTMNLILTAALAPNATRVFLRCKGFWTDHSKSLSFCEDGVHLTKHGNRNLYANIRSALAKMFHLD